MTSRVFKSTICGKNGMTLAEVIVSIAIFSIIMLAAGRYIIFSLNSWKSIQTSSYSISRVNNFVLVMEKEVRHAKAPSPKLNAVSVFAGLNGTEPTDKGSRVDIYNLNNDGVMIRITYLVYNDAFYRKVTYLSDDPPNSPDDFASLIPVIPAVRNLEDSFGEIIPAFEFDVDRNQLMIRFKVANTNALEEILFEVNTSYTVRNQGVT